MSDTPGYYVGYPSLTRRGQHNVKSTQSTGCVPARPVEIGAKKRASKPLRTAAGRRLELPPTGAWELCKTNFRRILLIFARGWREGFAAWLAPGAIDSLMNDPLAS